MEQILTSKTKKQVAAFFTVRPQRFFYFGELKRKIKSSQLLPVLEDFGKQGILLSQNKQGKRYFQLNAKHPLFSQFKIWGKKNIRASEDEALKILKKLNGLKMAVLAGIFVGQKMECDLLLVGKISERQLLGFEKAINNMMGQEINFAVMDLQEFSYRKGTFDRFMKDVLENSHLVLIDKITQKKKEGK